MLVEVPTVEEGQRPLLEADAPCLEILDTLYGATMATPSIRASLVTPAWLPLFFRLTLKATPRVSAAAARLLRSLVANVSADVVESALSSITCELCAYDGVVWVWFVC
jgi:hypothetical protein